MKKLLKSPITGVIFDIIPKVGEEVSAGTEVVILEAMKMETALKVEWDCIIKDIRIEKGAMVSQGDVIMALDTIVREVALGESQNETASKAENVLLNELNARKKFLEDDARPEAVAKRHGRGQQMARKNVEQLVDAGSFNEFGSLIVAAQRTRRTMEDLIANTPADGLITGTATINQALFPADTFTGALIMAYDFTVLAGTQGTMNHQKMDRVLEMAKVNNLPVILFGEGGGGRPGDVDVSTVAGLFIKTFVAYAGLETPKIAIVSGYCFAGNAALVGSSDIVIGTENISIGMGGPAMIEGGGLGKFHPREVGPAQVHSENGVVDVLVKDEPAAIKVAQQYLSYFQGASLTFDESDQASLRDMIPTNRKRMYEVRKVIETLADVDSVLELRPGYGKGMITALVRIKGEPYGLFANNPGHEAGAITADGAIKCGEFLELCNRFGLPLISLVDTPGIMVGPESEKTGNVKHASRIFNISARLKVPLFVVVLRRAYGLGAMAMMGGSTHSCDFIVSWPTGEFGAMGLEGAVQLGYKKELEAETDLVKRKALYDSMVEESYQRGKALSMATMFEIDDVVDPIVTRERISAGLKAAKRR